MLTVWVCIAATAVASFAIKAIGPVLLGARSLPARAQDVVALLAPVLLVALVVTDVLGPRWSGFDITVVAGLAAAAAARLRDSPALLAVAVGVAVTVALRAIAS